MVYLARGRDVDTPAVVVLLDGDGEADGIREELKEGYRDKKYVDDEFVIQSSDIDVNDVTVATDTIREIEDLIPVDLVVMAIRRYASGSVARRRRRGRRDCPAVPVAAAAVNRQNQQRYLPQRRGELCQSHFN